MLFVGFDIGGTKCAVSLGEASEKDTIDILSRKQFSTPERWEDALDALFHAASELLSGRKPDACGFSCGGPLDAKRGIVLSPPNLPGWDAVPVTRLAEEALSVPAFLENDANACALAEWRWGAGKGTRDMAFLTFGTGLGAGLILDGRLYRGANGNAGEVGHIRLSPFGPTGYGKEGSFEGFCSGGGIAQLADTLARREIQRGAVPSYFLDGRLASTREVADAARNGDETALEVFRVCGRMLGQGLSILTDLINPECIVIGSIFARCGDLLRTEMDKVMRQEALVPSYRAVRVVPAMLGDSIGDYAALSVAACGRSATF